MVTVLWATKSYSLVTRTVLSEHSTIRITLLAHCRQLVKCTINKQHARCTVRPTATVRLSLLSVPAVSDRSLSHCHTTTAPHTILDINKCLQNCSYFLQVAPLTHDAFPPIHFTHPAGRTSIHTRQNIREALPDIWRTQLEDSQTFAVTNPY